MTYGKENGTKEISENPMTFKNHFMKYFLGEM